MRKALFAVLCLLCAIAPAAAQNTIAVSGSNVQGLNGGLLVSGSICFQGTDANGNVISFQQSGGGSVVTLPYCSAIANGVIAGFNVANPANTSPVNIRYHIQIKQGPRIILDSPGAYLCNMAGACTTPYAFNFDNCFSSGACINTPIPQTTGPAGPPGMFNFVSSLPALCAPGVTQSVELSVAPYTAYYCSATNTWTAVGGTGTVTTASCANLSPLFTCSVATPTSTPAISFAQQTESANQIFAGPSSGAAANPAFRALAAADLPSTVRPYIQHVTVTPQGCPDGTAGTTCYVVADDTQLVSDATWSAGATVQVTLGSSPPRFQCPGASYPCSTGPSSPTNDIGKSGQAGANCRAINPMQCDTSIPAGTITSIQSATQATLSSTAATASSTGSGYHWFSWGTPDDTPLQQANDFCLTLRTWCTVDLPCGRMFMAASDFTSVRVTRSNNLNRPYFLDGHHCAEFNISQNFNCGDINGCFLDLPVGAGQLGGNDGWTDGASGILFFTFFDTPAAGQFPGTSTYRLINTGQYARSDDIWVIGAFWNIATTRIVYGQSCSLCSTLVNNVSWSSGNRGLYASGPTQGTATISSGFYGNSLQHSCDIDGQNVVLLSGTQCNFPLSSNATEAGAGLDTLSTFTGQLWSIGSNIQGSPYLNGGTIHLMDYYANPQGAASGIFVQNAAVKLYLHGWHNAPNGGPWLHLSAGTVTDACGNSGTGGFGGSNLPVISGGTFIPCGGPSGTMLVNAQLSTATCAASQANIFLFPYGQTASSDCSSATARTQIGGWVAPRAGTLYDLNFTAATGGVAGDKVTVFQNGSASIITCTYATATSCNDFTHSITVAAGDLIGFSITTGAADTTTVPKASVVLF